MRETVLYTVEDENRDKGRQYLVTEMSAADGERWSKDIIHALAQSGVALPEDYSALTVAGVAALGFKMLASVPGDEVDRIMDRMMDCVEFIPDPSNPDVRRGGKPPRPPMRDDDIEEVMTRLKLKGVVFRLLTGFLKAAVSQRLGFPTTAALN